ncbi:phosphatase 2C-like domain-containing protein [Mycena amicta]|nr:phosphatase 2C-like domain-containing protein [Mycena amicta]
MRGSRFFSFQIGASWAAKPPYELRRRIPFPPNPAIVAWRNSVLAKLGKTSPSGPGEDFLFTREHDHGVVFGVADGVGGWSDRGVDPAAFSQALLYYADQQPPTASPSECMQSAHHSLLADNRVDVGATACFLSFNTSGLLKTANLGDSGFCIYRGTSIFYASPPQTHYFNCPRQLSKLKRPGGRDLWQISESITDSPAAADLYDCSLLDGDVVIAYTDGISDNIWPDEIAQICALALNRPHPQVTLAELISSNLVYYARKRMFSHHPTPFEVESRRHNSPYRGGVSESTPNAFVLTDPRK